MADEQTFRTPHGTLRLQLEPEVKRGTYSNFQVLSSNETEFVLDFAYLPPGQQGGDVLARMILSPKHAKVLMTLLGQRIADYEARFGPIAPPSQPPPTTGSGLPN